MGDGVSIMFCELQESIVTNCGVVGECTGEVRKLVSEEDESPREIWVK